MLRRCYTQVFKIIILYIKKKRYIYIFIIQNIDTLEFAAGISKDCIITAHGSYQSSTCQKKSCKKKYSKEWLTGSFF